MRGNTKYIIFLCLAFLLLFFVAFLQPKPINWIPTFSVEDDIPYGLKLVYNRLEDIFPEAEIRSDSRTLYEMKAENAIPTNVISISTLYQPDSLDLALLQALADKGHHFFIAANSFSNNFEQQFNLSTDFSYNFQDSIYKVTLNDATRSPNEFFYRTDNVQAYFVPDSLNDWKVIAYTKNSQPVLISKPLGQGSLTLSAQPLAFTNYYLLDSTNHEFISTAFSYLPPGDVLVNQYAALGRVESRSLLRFIASEPALAWAWRIAVVSIIGFVIFSGKRKQRIIPVLNPPVNATLDFTRTIARLYQENGNYTEIALKRMQFWLDYIRKKYNLSTNKLNEDFIKVLSNKRGVNEKSLTELVDMIRYLQNGNKLNQQNLIIFNKKLEAFYKKNR